MKKIHVLNLPSWYPGRFSQIRGAFFRQRILNNSINACRMGVIYVENIPLHRVAEYIQIADDKSSSCDELIPTFRDERINWTPRIWYLIERSYVKKGLRLFESYVKAHGLPDLVHVYSGWPAGFLALKIFQRYGIPYVLSEHSSMFFQNRLIDYFRISRLNDVYEFAKGRFAVSSVLAQHMEFLYKKKRGYWGVVHNPVNPKFLTEALALEKRSNCVFGHLSLLNKNKNVDQIICAFSSLVNKLPDAKLVIAGAGKESNALKEIVITQKLEHHVKFTGLLDLEAVPEFFQSIDVLVHASKFETFGNVIVEAMAFGVPVISTRSGGPDDIITEECGILVDVDDLYALESSLMAVATEQVSWDRFRIRELCEMRFSPESISAKWRRIYDDVVLT